jgi:hypothetical protein
LLPGNGYKLVSSFVIGFHFLVGVSVLVLHKLTEMHFVTSYIAPVVYRDGVIAALFAALALAAAITYSNAKAGDTASPNRLTAARLFTAAQ